MSLAFMDVQNVTNGFLAILTVCSLRIPWAKEET